MNRRLLAAFYLLYALLGLCCKFRKDDGDYLKLNRNRVFGKKDETNIPSSPRP